MTKAVPCNKSYRLIYEALFTNLQFARDFAVCPKDVSPGLQIHFYSLIKT